MHSEQQANILLVDDRPENLLAMETILAGLGQRLVRASSGREALRFLLQEDAAVVLLDVQMPGLDGFETAQMIRSRERSEHTPIIFITAYNRDDQYVFQGYSLGAVDYLLKPFEPEVLRSKVKVFIELYKKNEELKRQAALLAAANRDLDGLNAELEARVEERTAQLRDANVVLQAEVAERRRVEQEREKLLLREQALRQQAEQASRLKDEFLATVSHELRTPLNAITGWAQLLRAGKIGADDRRKAVETICHNAKSQARLIEDLLDVSRIITGKLRLDLRPVSVASIIEAAADVVRPAAEAKGIALAVMTGADRTVICDPQRLQQVVWNLLSNAIKFTPKGGCVSAALTDAGGDIQIAVSDTGEGVKPEFLPYVFDRFRQADGSSTRAHGGLGLGLAIVRHLVELHGGTVNAESAGAGRGATFTIRLPGASVVNDAPAELRPSPLAGYASAQDALPALDGARVLVVDDEPDTLEMMVYVLERCGAEARAASSVAEAIAALGEWPPDVIVSDIGLPDEDGYALMDRIRSLEGERGGRLPAIALTAYARVEDRDRALAAGYQMHLTKPVDPGDLAQAVLGLTRETAKTKAVE
jgi:signal transduction histidine kinase